MKKLSLVLVLLLVAGLFTGCRDEVPQGSVGRVKTSGGWDNELLKPGLHSCWGYDKMFTADSTQRTYNETINILVGGKVNLTLTVSTRCGINIEDKDKGLSVFENVTAEDGKITHENMYKTYLQMKVLALPQEIIGAQPDVQTVIAIKGELLAQIRKRLIEDAATTPFNVSAFEFTNYDWPKTITEAQEQLVSIQLEEERTAARVRAELKAAEGQLKIEEANKLVELKKAEAVAESIEIIKQKLASAPEYLQWHQIRMLSEAAQGPNNAFIIIPYGMPTEPVVNNAQLKQFLDSKDLRPESTKK